MRKYDVSSARERERERDLVDFLYSAYVAVRTAKEAFTTTMTRKLLDLPPYNTTLLFYSPSPFRL